MALIVKEGSIDGRKGLFADKDYDAGAVLTPMRGERMTRLEMNNSPKNIKDNLLQVGPDMFLNLQGEVGFFANHSCNPNCYLKAVMNSGFLIAKREIKKGEELTYDYSLTSTDSPEEWSLQCVCHKHYCRGEVSGYKTLPEEKKQELQAFAPGYVK